MRFLPLGVVELAVLDATTGAHALHIAGGNAFDIADAVLVRQIARHHIADDFHVLVAVGAKAGFGRDAVFVDHAQIAPTHVRGVVVAGK